MLERGTAKNRLGNAMPLVRDSLTAVGGNRRLLAALCFVAFVAGLVESAALYIIARLTLTLATGDRRIDIKMGPLAASHVHVRVLTVIAAVGLIGYLVINYPVARLSARLSRRILVATQQRTVRSYLLAPWQEQAAFSEGRLQELVGEYCQRTERLFNLATLAMTSAFSIIALVMAALVTSPVAALALFGGLGVVGLALRPMTARVRTSAAQQKEHNRHIARLAAQTARVNQEIAAYHVAENVAERVARDIKQSGLVTERLRFSTRIAPVFYQFWALALVLGISAVMSFRASADTSALAPLMLLLVRGLGYGKQLQTATQGALELQPYVGGLIEELNALEGFPRATGGTRVSELDCVELNGVGYSYGPDLPPVLSDVNLRITRGETLGIVGPSGGGKTTLTQLLMRLRPPASGQIRMNDLPLDDVDADSWAQLVAFVPQENKLVRGTIADNVRFYRTVFTDEQVEAAARAAHLHDEIMQMPDGYDTEVGPGARDLSGGQRQRLGIARALLGGPQLLVLDEPTSALDSRSEELIRESLEEIRHQIAIVVVAHRPATVALCDTVIRVERGRVLSVAEPGGTDTPIASNQ